MSACERCGISAWHPEAHSCTFPDCAIRRAKLLPAAATVPSGGRLLAGDHAPTVTGGFVHTQRHERTPA